MNDPSPSPRDVLAARLREALGSRANVREVRMFGGLSFMVDGQLAVSAGRDGHLLVRVDPAERESLLRRGGEPASMGERPMGPGWLRVPSRRLADDDEDLAYWVRIGIASRDAPR